MARGRMVFDGPADALTDAVVKEIYGAAVPRQGRAADDETFRNTGKPVKVMPLPRGQAESTDAPETEAPASEPERAEAGM